MLYFKLIKHKSNCKSLLYSVIFSEEDGKNLIVRDYLSGVAFNNITRLAFGKRFMDSNGVINDEGKEFKTIVNNGNLTFLLNSGSFNCNFFTIFKG